MDSMTAILAGILCGLVGSFAPAFLFEKAMKPGTRVSMSVGIASVMVSFVFLSLALLAVYVLASTEVLTFGCAMVLTFLLFWAVEAVRAWKAAQAAQRAKEGKEA